MRNKKILIKESLKMIDFIEVSEWIASSEGKKYMMNLEKKCQEEWNKAQTDVEFDVKSLKNEDAPQDSESGFKN